MQQKPGILMGFDYGLRRIGVAIGQTLTGTATALTTLESRDGEPDWAAMGRLIDEWRPAALIVGMPRHRDRARHELAGPIERFCRQLEGRFGLPVHTVNERHSSAEASTQLRLARQSGRARRIQKTDIDSLSAAILLERWMQGETDG